MSDSRSDNHSIYSVDTSRCKDGVWLVKVPNYLANMWLQHGGDRTVGKVVITGPARTSTADSTRPVSEVRLLTDQELINQAGDSGKLIPKEHQFLIQTTPQPSTLRGASTGQELMILCEEDAGTPSVNAGPLLEAARRITKRYSLFGCVNSRAECRPPPNSKYMMLKAQQVKAKNTAKYKVVILDKALNEHLPVSNHACNIEYESRKKMEGKNMRREKEDVLQDLFKAFERHQYYAARDLVLLTKQPVTYLTEILREIANFNTKQPHKHMWELKAEYRHYTEGKPKLEVTPEQ